MADYIFHEGPQQSRPRTLCVRHGNDDPQKDGNLITYCQVLSYLLVMFLIDDVIAKADAKFTNLKQTEHMSAVGYWRFMGRRFTMWSCISRRTL